jgi:hypothetical protein
VTTLRIPTRKIDAAELQRACVGYGDVAVDAPKEHGMTAGDFIDVPSVRRDFNRPESLVPTGTENPFTRFRLLDFFGDAIAEFVERLHACEINAQLGSARVIEMQVRVVESGHEEVPIEIDDLGLRAFELVHVGGLADGQNTVSSNGYRLFAKDGAELCVCGHASVDVGVNENEVSFGLGVACGSLS